MNTSKNNCSDDDCLKCVDLGVYDVGEVQSTSVHLLRYAAAHCFIVFLLGTLCNAVALWCIVTCTRTKPAVKVLLCSVFLPILLICLVTRPAMGSFVLSVLLCDPERNLVIKMVFMLLYSSLAEMELFCIAVLSFFRATAVWSPQRHSVKLRVAVAVVVCISFYSVLTSVGWLGTLHLGILKKRALMRALLVLFFLLNTIVPVLVTMACYASMIVAMQRNKSRLANIHQKGSNATSVVDHATLGMLAVFVSNLVFSLPHSVYHILEKQSQTSHIIFHVLFSTHFVVDPVVFVWFNRSYRQRVGEKIRDGVTWITQCCCRASPSPRTASTFHLVFSSKSSSNDQQPSLDIQVESGKMAG